MNRPSSDQLPPPTSWDEFQSLCHRLWTAILNDPTAQQNGRIGQEQHGVDVFGRRNGKEWVGVQCKGKDRLTKKKVTNKELADEALKAQRFNPPLGEFILATTAPRDGKIQEEARRISAEYKKNGLFSITVWSWEDILVELDNHQDVAHWYRPTFYKSKSIPNSKVKAAERELKNSYGRCIHRWQASGLTRAEAINNCYSSTIGDLASTLVPTVSTPLRLLIAPVGSGKSLAAERFYQRYIKTFMASGKGPFPVFLEASTIGSSLENSIREKAVAFGDVDEEGVCLVVDGLDEINLPKAQQILSAIRVIINSWPSTLALLTSRPLKAWSDLEEVEELPPLSTCDAIALTSKAAGFDVSPFSHRWDESLTDAISRPLFAILLGNFLRGSRSNGHVSVASIVTHLVDSVLAKTSYATELRNTFHKLAIICTDNDNRATPGSISRPQREALLSSGVVIESDGALSFSLHLLQ